jgi:Ca2+-binding RTX toxin-like protein
MLIRAVVAPATPVLSCSLLPAAGAMGSADRAVPTCAGERATVVGTPQHDAIDLSSRRRPQVVVTKGGNDLVYGTRHNDRICGGAGRDKLFEMAGQDILKGGAGDDRFPDSGKRIVAGPGRDKIYLHEDESVTVLGGKGIDALWYADRDDTCRSIERWHYSRRGC